MVGVLQYETHPHTPLTNKILFPNSRKLFTSELHDI